MPSGIYKHKKRPSFSKEWRENMGKSHIGQVPWNKGIRTGPNPEHSKRMKGIVPWNKGKKIGPHAQEWKELMSKKMMGENGPNWQGGITLLNFKVRNSFRYRQWRSDIFERDNYTCQECGKNKCWIEAHHIKMFSIIMKENNIKSFDDAITCEELWNLNNGITLCKECHRIENKKQMINNKNAIKNGVAITDIKSINSVE